MTTATRMSLAVNAQTLRLAFLDFMPHDAA